MASTSHRRCQYRGDGCMGTAHAGHDQCAHCYFQYIKPALQAERAEVKRRRELKKMRLSPANRALISEVDLKEPQIVERPEPLITVRDAVTDVLINQAIDRGIAEGKNPLDSASKLLTDFWLKEDLPILPPVVKEEQPIQIGPEPVLTRYLHAGGTGSRLTEAQVAEVIDAYADDSLQVKDICDSLNIATTTLYAILRDAKLPLRSTRPYRDRLDKRLAPLRKEPEMPQSTPPVSQPAVSPPPPNGVISDLTEWTVTYTVRKTETRVVAAKSFNDAAAAVGNLDPDIDVVSVAKVVKS